MITRLLLWTLVLYLAIGVLKSIVVAYVSIISYRGKKESSFYSSQLDYLLNHTMPSNISFSVALVFVVFTTILLHPVISGDIE